MNRTGKVAVTVLIVVVLVLSHVATYKVGYKKGADDASVYFSAHTMWDNAVIASRIVKGKEKELLKDLETTFLEYPNLKTTIEKNPNFFDEKIDLSVIEHYLNLYYEAQGKSVPDEVLPQDSTSNKTSHLTAEAAPHP